MKVRLLSALMFLAFSACSRLMSAGSITSSGAIAGFSREFLRELLAVKVKR